MFLAIADAAFLASMLCFSLWKYTQSNNAIEKHNKLIYEVVKTGKAYVEALSPKNENEQDVTERFTPTLY
ncbi:MAG: hypothetical protein WC785_04610 [Tatlockia sp.]